MATLIDSLTVSLGLDATQFKKGQEEATASLNKTKTVAIQTGKEMEASGQQAAQFFSAVKNQALALFAVVLGGKSLEVFAKDTTRALVGLGQAAGHLGTAVPQLDAFAKMIGRNGGNAEEATAQFIALHDAMMQFALTGQSPIAGPLLHIGASRTDNAIQVAKKFADFAEAHPALRYQIGHGLGFSDATIEGLKRSNAMPGGVEAELARVKELGVVNKEMTDQAGKITHAFGELTQAADFAATKLLHLFSPWLISFIDATRQSWFPTEKEKQTYLGSPEGQFYQRWGLASQGVGGRGIGSHPPVADTSMSPEQQEFLRYLSGPESNGDYTLKNGGQHFSDMSKFPQGVGAGGTSTASGRYQFIEGTWQEVSRETGRSDFSPISQDRNAWYLAEREYRKKTGRDLHADLKAGGHDAEINRALAPTWPSLPGGSQSHYSPNGVPPRGPIFGLQIDPALRIPPGTGIGAGGGVPNINVGAVTINTTASTMKGAGDAMGHALAERILRDANRGLTQ